MVTQEIIGDIQLELAHVEVFTLAAVFALTWLGACLLFIDSGEVVRRIRHNGTSGLARFLFHDTMFAGIGTVLLGAAVVVFMFGMSASPLWVENVECAVEHKIEVASDPEWMPWVSKDYSYIGDERQRVYKVTGSTALNSRNGNNSLKAPIDRVSFVKVDSVSRERFYTLEDGQRREYADGSYSIIGGRVDGDNPIGSYDLIVCATEGTLQRAGIGDELLEETLYESIDQVLPDGCWMSRSDSAEWHRHDNEETKGNDA